MRQLNSLLPCLNRLRLFIVFVVVTTFLTGCEKDPEPLYDNGMIKGHIILQTPGYETINGNDVKVIAHGPYGSKSTTSEPNGQYTLSGLGNGTYEIEFNKEGFGILRMPGYQIFGNDTISISPGLYKKANYKMPKLTAQTVQGGFPVIKTNLTASTVGEMQIRVFLSDTKDVSYKNYMYTEMASASEGEFGIIYMNFNPDPEYVNWGGPIFESGQKRYMIAYVCSGDDPGFFNRFYHLTIYTTVDLNQHSQVFEL